MGVTQLWQILAPVEQHLALSSLEGQTLAVDLSIWVCENQCVKQMQGVVTKPYLRNLFFRISHLTQLGVKLVFVIEGSAPELKWDTMIKRQQSRFPGRQGKQPQQRPAGKQTRRNFNSWLKECCEMLEILGIPYIQSKGEAEALCALLNSAGLVDGCLTNDGDAFLYGATTVYRNFTMNTKDPHVEMYRLSDIQSKLGIDRGGLVALGLLIGCDFVPKGVPGIGIANAVRLLQSLQGQDVLIRLQSWSTMSEKDCVDQTEILARRKAIQVPDFPQIKVIDEFLVAKDRCPTRLPQWKRPVPAKLQEFSLIKLEWPIEYTIEKVLPLITLWDMHDLLGSKNPSIHQHLKPHRIVKTRVRQGEPCFEVEWIKPVTDTVNDGSYYVTIETQDLFTKCYPVMTRDFVTQTEEQKKKPKAKKKKKKVEAPAIAPPSLDDLSFKFEKVNLGQVTSKLQEAAKGLHPSFTEYDETALTTKAKQPRHLTLSPNAKKSTNIREGSESKKPAVFPSSVSQETLSKSMKDSAEEAFVPLSQRVKLRMQNKHDSNKENEDKQERRISKSCVSDQKICAMKSPGGDLSNMSSLLEDIQNLSLKEQENFRQKMKEKPMLTSKFLSKHSPHSVSSKHTPAGVSKKVISVKDIQKMSSPSAETFCSPMTYMKHQGGLGESFEIQKSPYYIENPWAASKAKSEKGLININSPGFFARPDAKKELEQVDNRSATEKLVEKIESGINEVGGSNGIHVDHISSAGKKTCKSVSNGDNLTVDSLMSILHSSEKASATPSHELSKLKISTPGNQSVSGLDSTSMSQFGDFQIQHSLLNSLCSSLVQALTPKGVTMSKEEYDKLVATLNVLDSEDDEVIDENDIDGNMASDDVACNIDFSELEKASTGFKNLNQKLLLRPIQIDDEDVMSKLSKSARKKLRRRERKREQELENLALTQNSSHYKGKINNCAKSTGKSTKRNSVKFNNAEIKTTTEDVNNTNRKLDKSMRANEKGMCTLSRKKSVEKLQSDLQTPGKTDVNKMENTELINTRPDDANLISCQHELIVEKIKKKRKKKKVKKASPLIDISADESVLDDKKVESCEEYLKKALENNQRKVPENKIVKASPFMDFSADNTLLELEELSCKVVGEEVDAEVHSKLKQRKMLSKEKMNKEYNTSQTNELPTVPILSINSVLSNDLDEKAQGKQETDVKDEVLKGNSNELISGKKSEKLKQSEYDGQASCLDSAGNLSENLTSLSGDDTKDFLVENNNLSEIHENDNEGIQANEDTVECHEKESCNDLEKRNAITRHESEKGHGNNVSATELHKETTKEQSKSANENGIEYCAIDNESKYTTEPYDGTLEHKTDQGAIELKNGDKTENHKGANENGAETYLSELKNRDTFRGLEDVNQNENEICKAIESGDEIDHVSANEMENASYDVGICSDHQRSNLNHVGNDTECFSNRILSKPSENINLVNGCHKKQKDILSVSNRNDRVSNYEISDVEEEADSGARDLADGHETSTTYQMKQNNGIYTEAETHIPCDNPKDILEEEFHQVSQDSLVLKSENNSEGNVESCNDENVESCNFSHKWDRNYGCNSITGNAERISEIMVSHKSADICVTDERNGADICVGSRDESCDKPKMKSKDEIKRDNAAIGLSVDLSSSTDVEEKNTLRRYNLEEYTGESGIGLFEEITGDDKEAWEKDVTKSEVFQSPACLADRLKLKIRKTSTRNVLDVFTNGK